MNGRGFLTRPVKEQTLRGQDDPFVSSKSLKLRTAADILPVSQVDGNVARKCREGAIPLEDQRNVSIITSVVSMHLVLTKNVRVEAIARTHNVSMAQVALAWSLSKSFMTAPIVGTTSLEKLKDLVGTAFRSAIRIISCLMMVLVGGVHLKLTDEETKSIDDLYQPRAVFGH